MRTRQPVSFIASSSPDDACEFYRDVLGLDLVERSAYAVVFADGKNTLRVQIIPGFKPVDHTVHGWQVTDIAHEIASLKDNGVTCLVFDQLEQDANGIWTTPDGNMIVWFNDPSGNILSFTQFA